MEPTLQLMCEDASLLLEAADAEDQATKSFQASLDDEKKRYQDTLDTAMATSDMLKSGYYGYCTVHSINNSRVILRVIIVRVIFVWGYNFAFSCKWLTIFHYNSNTLPQPMGHNLMCLGLVKLNS